MSATQAQIPRPAMEPVGDPTAWSAWHAGSRPIPLMDVDPDLGAGLSPERLAMARSELRVRIVRLPRGEWAADDLSSISQDNVGLLMLDGVIAREILLEDTVSTELLGAKDLIRPWSAEGDPELLQQMVRWQVLAEARLAVLGLPFAAAVARFPEVSGVLIDRA